MRFPTDDKLEDLTTSQHLQRKRWLLPITNACNLSCGGCAQLCGHFSPDKIWTLTLEEIDYAIGLVKPYTGPDKFWHEFTIFGGEPTVHPQWDQIPDLLAKHAPMKFRINTNGRLGQAPFERDRNMTYHVDLHPPDQLFLPTMIAAADVTQIKDKAHFWKLAQRNCDIWADEGSMIYNGKAYFCEHAAAMDWMFNDGKFGWELQEGVNPFDHTDEEIAQQAEHFCHRCAWCVADKVPRQRVGDKSQVSPLNYDQFPRKQLIQLTAPDGA
jgi:hypothetical protein